ncbi:MAG: hypothetical protein K2X29_06060 [Candidatus Obscuribacterales bacterium]|nr:hypothetical protein [Candidatus Obscuribacterales bacterium]
MTALQNARSTCPYLLLGLTPSAGKDDIAQVYERLKSSLDEDDCLATPQSWVQARQAVLSIEDAYKRILDGDESDEPVKKVPEDLESWLPPKLGQLLVASGKITLEQLQDALREQAVLQIPLGEILKSASLVTQMELDSFLLSQRLINLPADTPHQIGQRLIGLGLVTEDMVRIALVEQRTSEKPLGQILVERGWLADEIFQALDCLDPISEPGNA